MSEKNYKYIDFIRAFSIFLVILLHCICDYYANTENVGKALWFILSYVNELSRIGVPLFFMISGYLILSKDITDIKEFYKKRFLKIGIPFILYDILYYIYMNLSSENSITISGFFKDLVNCGSAYHLWFVYSILILYLIMPFLQIIVKNCDMKKLILLFVISIFQTSIRPLINSLLNGSFYVFISDDGFNGYIGYVLLGYILGTYQFKNYTKNVIYVLSLLTFIITPVISVNSVIKTGEYLFISGYSLNHYVEAAGIFLWCRLHIKNTGKTISKISQLSFSAYLIHVLFLEIMKPLPIDLSPSAVMLMWFIIVSVLSFTWSNAEHTLKSIIKTKIKR